MTLQTRPMESQCESCALDGTMIKHYRYGDFLLHCGECVQPATSVPDYLCVVNSRYCNIYQLVDLPLDLKSKIMLCGVSPVVTVNEGSPNCG